MIKSKRNVYVPSHTTQEVKRALDEEVQKQRRLLKKNTISVSKIVHDILAEALRRRGYPISYDYKVS